MSMLAIFLDISSFSSLCSEVDLSPSEDDTFPDAGPIFKPDEDVGIGSSSVTSCVVLIFRFFDMESSDDGSVVASL
jgi:hypothetical protein